MLPTFSSDPQLSLAGQRWLETPMLSSVQSQQHPLSCKKSKALLSAAVLQIQIQIQIAAICRKMGMCQMGPM